MTNRDILKITMEQTAPCKGQIRGNWQSSTKQEGICLLSKVKKMKKPNN